MSRKDLMAYYPPMLKQVYEFGRISEALEPALTQALRDVWEIQSAHSATAADEIGISKLESVFGITPKDTDSLDIRRARIIARINAALPPYTEKSLRQRLTAICGEDAYTLLVDSENLKIYIGIQLKAKSLYPDVIKMLEYILPANLEVNATLIWNTHEMLKRYTHQELKARTHFGWKGEVINGN